MLIVPFSGCFVKILLYITDDFVAVRCSPAPSCSAGQAAGGRGAPGLKGRPAPAGRAGAATWGECWGGAGGAWLGAGCPEVAPRPGVAGTWSRHARRWVSDARGLWNRSSSPGQRAKRGPAPAPGPQATHAHRLGTDAGGGILPAKFDRSVKGGGSRREGPQRVGRGSRGRWLDTATRPTRGVGSRWVPLDARANFAILGPPSG